MLLVKISPVFSPQIFFFLKVEKDENRKTALAHCANTDMVVYK